MSKFWIRWVKMMRLNFSRSFRKKMFQKVPKLLQPIIDRQVKHLNLLKTEQQAQLISTVKEQLYSLPAWILADQTLSLDREILARIKSNCCLHRNNYNPPKFYLNNLAILRVQIMLIKCLRMIWLLHFKTRLVKTLHNTTVKLKYRPKNITVLMQPPIIQITMFEV